jgi:hypothetical protein
MAKTGPSSTPGKAINLVYSMDLHSVCSITTCYINKLYDILEEMSRIKYNIKVDFY